MVAGGKATAEPKKPMGRPSTFSKGLASAICKRIAEGESLRSICLGADMPCLSTVIRWLADDRRSEFRSQYARAREAQADTIFDEILDIADDASNDWMERKRDDGSTDEVLHAEHVQRSKLRIDARKWVAGKLQPKKYGDKLELDGKLDIAPVTINLVRQPEAPDAG